MPVPSDLIPAELDRPPLRPGFVARPGLVARLDEALEGRLTIVSAPAGYGKSTLAAERLAHLSAVPPAWLSAGLRSIGLAGCEFVRERPRPVVRPTTRPPTQAGVR